MRTTAIPTINYLPMHKHMHINMCVTVCVNTCQVASKSITTASVPVWRHLLLATTGHGK